MIEEIDYFELARHKGPYEKWPSKTKLFYNSVYTGTKLPGYIIEKQFKLGNFYFIVTSQDCDFEESNEYLLLNNRFKVIDRESLGNWYITYLLEDYKCINNNEIILRYMGDLYIKITLRPEKKGLFARKITYEKCNGYT